MEIGLKENDIIEGFYVVECEMEGFNKIFIDKIKNLTIKDMEIINSTISGEAFIHANSG